MGETLQEAKEKYNSFYNTDPFPEIQAALLNSADIQDYVYKTGMIHPFNCTTDNFKPASYSINFSGEYLYWDIPEGSEGRRTKIYKQLKEGEHFVLRRNSIAFLRLEPYVQLPLYMAARFNLQIKHVYRGLLLGTGPLVDPGYRGFINIPLHNLTDEDYKIEFGEAMIWMEFTKISHNSSINLDTNKYERKGQLATFKKKSQDKDLEYFLHRANPNSPILSSLPQLISEYNKSFKEAEKINERTNTLISRFSIAIVLSIASIVVAIIGFMYNLYTVGNNSINSIKQSNILMIEEHNKSLELKHKIDEEYASQIDSLKSDNMYIHNLLDSIVGKP